MRTMLTAFAFIVCCSLPGTAAAEKRPATLGPLYVALGTLQVLDVHSTGRALDRHAYEVNPIMKGFAGNRAALFAVKAAGTAGVVLVSEKMWKRNRAAAVVFMVATNAAMAVVVHKNYAAVR